MEQEMIKQLKIERFETTPSPSVFASQIESKNVPAVFNGCINQWKAFTNWNPANGGLDYLQERVGSCSVEAMLSRNAPVFYGDLRSHERIPFPFSTFIDYCKQRLLNTVQEHHQSVVVPDAGEEDHSPQQIYLAQVPILNTEDQERVQFETLKEDIQMLSFLETKDMASINLWMNSAHARSSTHYDPHHNVLCIVSGRKQVILWPPSASPSLYPMPIYGEASNHSSISLESPDFSLYPRAEFSSRNSQMVVLHAGDALFIPEGWFHQVDSDDLTIAVNFWWRSSIMSSMLEHMDAYYLRRILRRLTDKEMNNILQKVSSPTMGKQETNTCKLLHNGEADPGNHGDLREINEKHRVNLDMMEPLSLQALHELVSLVHDRVNLTNTSYPEDSTSTDDLAVNTKSHHDMTVTNNSFTLEDDPVAKILWTLDPHTFQNVVLAMAYNFPRTLEALVSHLLSPIGAEVLTKKFDELDQQNTEEDRNKFYQVLYAAFDDQFAAMNAILNGKESFGLQRAVEMQYEFESHSQ